STGLPAASSFYSVWTDTYASAAAATNWTIGSATTAIDGDSWEHWYPMGSLQSSKAAVSPFNILATPDETINIVVTKKIEDTFPVIANYRSPYYQLTAGRMMLFGGAQVPGSWTNYRTLYEHLRDWGVTDLNIVQYQSRKWGISTILTPN